MKSKSVDKSNETKLFYLDLLASPNGRFADNNDNLQSIFL